MKEQLPDNSEAIITRHSIRGNHAEYEGLSEAGIEQAKERAKDFVDIIEKSEPGTVFFFAGRSDEVGLFEGHRSVDAGEDAHGGTWRP